MAPWRGRRVIREAFHWLVTGHMSPGRPTGQLYSDWLQIFLSLSYKYNIFMNSFKAYREAGILHLYVFDNLLSFCPIELHPPHHPPNFAGVCTGIWGPCNVTVYGSALLGGSHPSHTRRRFISTNVNSLNGAAQWGGGGTSRTREGEIPCKH